MLLDLRLPLVDGIDVLRQIRSNARTSLVPVVILTSSNEERDVVEAYSLRANSYILKPLEFDKFSNIVKHFADYWLLFNHQPASCHSSQQLLSTAAG